MISESASADRWTQRRTRKAARLARAASYVRDGRFAAADAVALLEAIVEPGDLVCVEGNNQKQAD